jgi:pyridoxine 5'-phosphate synthase PdxJ
VSINWALGMQAGHDLNYDGVVNVVDIQIVIAAVLGPGCGAS